MKKAFIALAFTAAVSGTAAAQTPAPVPNPRGDSTLDLDIDIDVDFLDELDEMKLEIREETRRKVERAMADWALQFPVPAVPPVPPVPAITARDAERAREAEERAKERAERARERQARERQNDTTEPFARTFKVGKGAALTIENASGNIQVAPGAGDVIDVQARKRAWGPDAEEAKRRLADTTIEVYATGNRVDLRVEHSERRQGSAQVEFDVKVPADTSLDLRTASGDVRVTNVAGEIRLQAVSGNVALEGTPRLVLVRAVSGDITATNAGSETQLSVSTVSGNVLLQTMRARSLDLNTVSGDIRVTDWSGDRSSVRTLSGSLQLQGSLAKGGRYDLESHSGSLNLALPDQPGFDLEANTFSGSIRVDFPIRVEGPVREAGRGPRTIRGTYGDASATLRVQTFSGSLTITRR